MGVAVDFIPHWGEHPVPRRYILKDLKMRWDLQQISVRFGYFQSLSRFSSGFGNKKFRCQEWFPAIWTKGSPTFRNTRTTAVRGSIFNPVAPS
jgi:hypothetical protein